MVPGWVSFTAWPAWVSVYCLSNQRGYDLNTGMFLKDHF